MRDVISRDEISHHFMEFLINDLFIDKEGC